MGYVYIYYGKNNECKYVGQSIDWKRRFYQHTKTDMKNNYPEVKNIIVIKCAREKMNIIEAYLINVYLPEWNKSMPPVPNQYINLNKYKKFKCAAKDLLGAKNR